MRRIVWTRRAIEDTQAIKTFIAQDSPRSANLVVERLIVAIEQIPTFPESGRICRNFRSLPSVRSFVRRIASCTGCGKKRFTSSQFTTRPAYFTSNPEIAPPPRSRAGLSQSKPSRSSKLSVRPPSR